MEKKKRRRIKSTGSWQTDAEMILCHELAHPKHTPLPKHKANELALKAAQGDQNAKYTLITTHLRLVSKIARRLTGKGIPFLDLFQEGVLALIHLLNFYNPQKFKGGVKSFPSIAARYVEKQLLKLISHELYTPRPYPHGKFLKIVLAADLHSFSTTTPTHTQLSPYILPITSLSPIHAKTLSLYYGTIDNHPRSISHIAHTLALPPDSIQHLIQDSLKFIKNNAYPTITAKAQKNAISTISSIPIPKHHKP